jgi:hypothetical protein
MNFPKDGIYPDGKSLQEESGFARRKEKGGNIETEERQRKGRGKTHNTLTKTPR